ncbi:MAG TPA: extracellular solute-binding protein [Luteimicrobium sp.]|jgi:sulfate transport system substrate-binding protein|nr:extracellular solute-binding protein [Luteimicrobium sp.]
MTRTRPRPAARAAVAVATAALALGLAACSGSSSAADKVAVVGYSVPQPAYDALEAAFQKTDAGKGVTFTSSFGPSGSQSKAVAAGQKADYVAFSVEPDVQNLVPAKVDAGWSSDATKGNVSDSVVVIVTRKGNPLHITGWDDIVKPGVKIVTADPASSGSAKWNILAAYEHEVATGGSEADAKAYLTKFFGNTVSRASSGAVAMTQFLGGTGDVLISYENEAIAARQAGNDVDYVVPDDTFLIENPAAVTKTASKPAKDFLAFVKSDDGQKIFASKGFRPVSTTVDVGTVEGANDPSKPFPEVAKLTTIADLGGWDAVNKKFFGDSGLVTAIEGDA